MQPNGPCKGGCDICAARAAGELQQRDLGPEARLLLAAVAGLKGKFGLGKSVALLRWVHLEVEGLRDWVIRVMWKPGVGGVGGVSLRHLCGACGRGAAAA